MFEWAGDVGSGIAADAGAYEERYGKFKCPA
jgi:hypothetical protein